MTAFKEYLEWFRDFFTFQHGGKYPDQLDETLYPTFPILDMGTKYLLYPENRVKIQETSSTNVSVYSQTNAVPDDKVRYVHMAIVIPSVGVTAQNVALACFDTVTLNHTYRIGPSGVPTTSPYSPVWLDRPAVLPPGTKLGWFADAAIGVGVSLQLRASYIDIDVGKFMRL